MDRDHDGTGGAPGQVEIDGVVDRGPDAVEIESQHRRFLVGTQLAVPPTAHAVNRSTRWQRRRLTVGECEEREPVAEPFFDEATGQPVTV